MRAKIFFLNRFEFLWRWAPHRCQSTPVFVHVFAQSFRDLARHRHQMRSPAANQRRRSRRNRQPSTPPNQTREIVFSPKSTYQFSQLNRDGVLILSRRKRLPPTAEQLQERKRKKIEIKTKQVSLVALRHKVVALWEHGANMENFQFRPKQAKHIIRFMQATYPQYAHHAAARSFVYRALKRHKEAADTPHLEPHRDRRGENKVKTKRENPQIVQMVDELLSEPKMTAPKVKDVLVDRGIQISVQTIQRIAQDLSYKWTKPWYTDVLTPAQKYKRKLFCMKLLRLGAPALLHTVSRWLFTDEKWWDVVGPSASRYVKAGSKTEAKMGNQVCCACQTKLAPFLHSQIILTHSLTGVAT